MSNSTTLLDTISASQASKEVTANAMHDAASPAMLFGRRASTTSALTWGYYGGVLWVDGVLTAIANGTVALSASTTNYVERTRAGVVSKNTSAFTPGSIPLYTIVTGVSTITSYTDHRITNFQITGRLSKSVAGSGSVTLTSAVAANQVLNFTGILTGNKTVVVPNGPQVWHVFNNTTGAYTLTIKTSAGTGIDVAQTKAVTLQADGTNVVTCNTDTAALGAQPLDAELTAIAGLTSASNKIPYFTGSGTAALLTLDTDGTLAANSDTTLASQKAVRTYVDTAVTGLLDFKGATDCSANPNYPAASKGDFYIVSVAGKIGGASGTTVEAGDGYYATADNAGGTEASVGTSWAHVEHNVILGTIATQNANAVAITGGAIDGTTIGGTTAAAITGTTITANTEFRGTVLTSNAASDLSFKSSAGEQLRVAHVASVANYGKVTGAAAGSAPFFSVAGSDTNIQVGYESKGTGVMNFRTGGAGGVTQMLVQHAATAVNYVNITGGATGAGPYFAAVGSDTNVAYGVNSKGTGAIAFSTAGGTTQQLRISNTTGAANYIQIWGEISGAAPVISVQGSDSNITSEHRSKGTGAHYFTTNAGSQTQLVVAHTASAVNYPQATGSATGNGVTIAAAGSDANIDFRVAPKGGGVFDITGTAATTAATPASFSAAEYLAIKINGVTKYLPLATATW